MNDHALTAATESKRADLRDVALLFLRLGCTAFGGPAAHVAMMEHEVVRKRRWLSAERFLDMMGAANMIPGPSSSELAIFIGYERAGWLGLLVAGLCFILPSALMTGGIAWMYVRFGSLPHVGGLLYGIKPAVIAIVVQALLSLAPQALKKSRWLAMLGVLACVATALKVDALVVLTAAGAASAVLRGAPRDGASAPRSFLFGPAAVAATPTTVASVGLGALFLTFLKLGAVIFGSGYVLLAFLRADLVEQRHWLTESQLIDAVAIGQVTPGPVFTTATFIGYLLGGAWGAAVATIAIFLPGFVFVSALRPLVARVRRSPAASAFFDGVNVASLALMTVVTVQLGRAALVDWVTVALAGISALMLLRFKTNPAWVVLGSALVGIASQYVR